jgi:hypothetical protein
MGVCFKAGELLQELAGAGASLEGAVVITLLRFFVGGVT